MPYTNLRKGWLCATTCLLMFLFLSVSLIYAQEPSLRTRWADDVTPESVLPEYPRPQMTRAAWQNLNGLWNYALAPMTAERPETFAGEILVPFPIESALSGVQQRVDGQRQRLWYQRQFELDPAWEGQRVLLHFGAVDWETIVWVNGVELGMHRGGYDPFSFDITDALTASGPQEVVVRVWDPSDAGSQPRGKQVREPEGIWYTPTTGIWQTVWLEPVPQASIADLTLTPDVDAGLLRVETLLSSEASTDLTVQADALVDGQVVATGQAAPGSAIDLSIENAELWSPDSPFLYDLRVTLLADGQAVDTVDSYFGMRKISIEPDAGGTLRLFLNNEPLFQYGLLDQGFFPDGLYTAPTDEALRYDIEVTKQLGFNMIRKHVKVEPARWYYWADQLGVLVWQDMPSGDRLMGWNEGEFIRTPASADQFELELERMIDTHYNAPSIVMWVLFNEGWGQYETARLTTWLEERDPTRIINSVSGWTDMNVGDVYDIHSYPGPDVPPQSPGRVSILGEFGGLGLPLAGHTWADEANWGYRQYETQDQLLTAYEQLITDMRVLVETRGLAAAVYTQTTDVEIEVNGLMTYDREIIKLDPERLRAINEILYAPVIPVVREVIVPTAEQTPVEWRYITERPADDWAEQQFDDSGWSVGRSGFGRGTVPNGVVNTEWTERGIWLRHTFELEDPAALVDPYVRVHHIEDAKLYLNGQEIAVLPFSTDHYVEVPLDANDRALLQPGVNTLAIYGFSSGFNAALERQYIDAGLYSRSEPGS